MTPSFQPEIVEYPAAAAGDLVPRIPQGVRHGRRPALRRGHHRNRSRGRDARPPARQQRRQGALAGARAVPAPGARQLEQRSGVRPRQVPRARGLVRPARPRLPARGQLLRGGQHQVLRRRVVPVAAGGLRRAAPPRWDLAGLADLLRRPGALLHPSRAPLPGARPARRGPDARARPARSTPTRRCPTNRVSSS